MKRNVIASLVAVLAAGLSWAADAATLASDSAGHSAYAAGWSTGANGGSGFGSWTLTSSGPNGGFFLGPSTGNAFLTSPGIDSGGRSWGIWANSGDIAAAFRPFGASLAVGQVFEVSMDNGFIDGGMAVGFTIRTGNATGGPSDYDNGRRFEFGYLGGDSIDSYKVVDKDGTRNIGVPFTGTGLQLAFTLTSATTYTFRVTDNASAASVTVTGRLNVTTLDSFCLYNRNAGAGPTHDAFFNSIAVLNNTPGATGGSVDSGGRRVSAAGITIDGCIGGIGGISSGGSPLMTAKHGYAGQLTEVANLTATASPSAVNEGTSAQLGGLAGMDDGTVTRVGGAEMKWRNPALPISYISPAGLASLGIVWQHVDAVVTGSYLGVTGSGSFLVYDSEPDNYGSYAGDGLPDWWQGGHFGLDNTNALPGANPDGDAFNNRDEYIADTDPDNPTSYFRIASMANVSPTCSVSFLSSPSRKYTLSSSPTLILPSWSAIGGQSNIWGSGGMQTMSDSNATPARVYGITVQLP